MMRRKLKTRRRIPCQTLIRGQETFNNKPKVLKMIISVNKLRCQCLLMKKNLRKKSHSRVRGHLKQLKTRTGRANSRDMMQIKAY